MHTNPTLDHSVCTVRVYCVVCFETKDNVELTRVHVHDCANWTELNSSGAKSTAYSSGQGGKVW